MDLSQNTVENINHMVEAIKSKLRMVNVGAVRSEDFNEDMYEELKDIYDMVMNKTNFSVSEMEAIASELGTLRR